MNLFAIVHEGKEVMDVVQQILDSHRRLDEDVPFKDRSILHRNLDIFPNFRNPRRDPQHVMFADLVHATPLA